MSNQFFPAINIHSVRGMFHCYVDGDRKQKKASIATKPKRSHAMTSLAESTSTPQCTVPRNLWDIHWFSNDIPGPFYSNGLPCPQKTPSGNAMAQGPTRVVLMTTATMIKPRNYDYQTVGWQSCAVETCESMRTLSCIHCVLLYSVSHKLYVKVLPS